MSFPPPTPKQTQLIWLSVSAVAVAVLVLFLVGLIWGLGQVIQILGPVLWPLAVAGVIAYLLDPVVDYFQRHKVPRTRAILSVFALAAMIVLGIAGSVLPQVVRETQTLVVKIPEYAAKLQQRSEVWLSNPPKLLRSLLNLSPMATPEAAPADPGTTNQPALGPSPSSPSQGGSTNAPASQPTTDPAADGWAGWMGGAIDSGTLKSASGWLAKVLPQVGSWVFGQVTKVASWFGVLAGLALIPVYAFYLLLEKEGIARSWKVYVPFTQSDFRDELVFVLQSINDYLIAFFRGQVLVALCDGALYAIGFLIIGLPYAVLIGVVASFLTLIPFIGAIITCAAALLIAVVQYGDWLHPGLVVAVFVVVQAIEGLVLQPKIIGDRVGLHPLAIIISVMVGTTLLGGILGGILAIPLTAALRVVMFRYIWKAPASETAAGG